MEHEFVIVSANRTAVGRFGGQLRNVPAADLAATVMKEAITQAGLTVEQVNEVVFGEVRQSTEASNLARVAALKAGIPIESSGYTVNRLCASGMQSVISGVQHLAFHSQDIVLAGGAENMSRAPLYLRNSRFGEGNPYIVDSNLENGQQPMEMYGKDLGMGMTAENVAEKYDISREDQDAFALESQKRAKQAWEEGRFDSQIVPIEIKSKKETSVFARDEHMRDTSLEKLASLKPVFKKDGTVTAGNACGRNDGASAIILMTAEKANILGLKPLAKVKSWSTTGVDPRYMGIGPVPAIEKLLKQTDLKVQDIGLWELNEAFASQSLAVIRQVGIPISKVNVNGGAIALGHPLGATGAIILTKLLHEMKHRNEQFGISTLCVGGGQGMAVLLENM
ncbi:thiolase family protein [Psychrobacillus sp. FSL K6-2684]|uniref:acetyl-CoA C-acetyltransferase n=1 Tax=Psychrobacillus faecigallinarum TaxID=2762235 RepID=A0ABR8RF08_9BACI|nr:thiolase family protein [Psychrobacillus faecigallinarum]MBD7946368.1 thiolase family protein [Psychrobacillus faecigallinarum]QGM32443.1 acetyl-CoA C-acyltransferase [Bacillus sp. N3536]